MDCFVASLLAMTWSRRHDDYTFAIPPRDAPELCMQSSAPKQRAWGMPGAQCTRSLVCAW